MLSLKMALIFVGFVTDPKLEKSFRMITFTEQYWKGFNRLKAQTSSKDSLLCYKHDADKIFSSCQLSVEYVRNIWKYS